VTHPDHPSDELVSIWSLPRMGHFKSFFVSTYEVKVTIWRLICEAIISVSRLTRTIARTATICVVCRFFLLSKVSKNDSAEKRHGLASSLRDGTAENP